jgi:hypothetical protein
MRPENNQSGVGNMLMNSPATTMQPQSKLLHGGTNPNLSQYRYDQQQ